MNITTEMIKELRDATKVSIMQCKKALEEAGGDMEKATMLLRKSSAASAAKKGDRTLGAGVIGTYVHTTNRLGAMVELQCETDFVAQNPEFIALASDIALHISAMNPEFTDVADIDETQTEKARNFFLEEMASIDKPAEIKEKILSGKMDDYFAEKTLMKQPFVKNPDQTIADLVNLLVQKTGERIMIGKFTRFEIA
jgi:elongation factor Ts